MRILPTNPHTTYQALRRWLIERQSGQVRHIQAVTWHTAASGRHCRAVGVAHGRCGLAQQHSGPHSCPGNRYQKPVRTSRFSAAHFRTAVPHSLAVNWPFAAARIGCSGRGEGRFRVPAGPSTALGNIRARRVASGSGSSTGAPCGTAHNHGARTMPWTTAIATIAATAAATGIAAAAGAPVVLVIPGPAGAVGQALRRDA
jgi:hypothetical protein